MSARSLVALTALGLTAPRASRHTRERPVAPAAAIHRAFRRPRPFDRTCVRPTRLRVCVLCRALQPPRTVSRRDGVDRCPPPATPSHSSSLARRHSRRRRRCSTRCGWSRRSGRRAGPRRRSRTSWWSSARRSTPAAGAASGSRAHGRRWRSPSPSPTLWTCSRGWRRPRRSCGRRPGSRASRPPTPCASASSSSKSTSTAF